MFMPGFHVVPIIFRVVFLASFFYNFVEICLLYIFTHKNLFCSFDLFVFLLFFVK